MGPTSLAGPAGNDPGFCIWLTGLPGSGKSTTAEAIRRQAETGREVIVIDGDVARKTISADLGFSRHDREENVRRIGRAAAEVVASGSIAICAVISPYARSRAEVRGMMPGGRFLEVYVNTPLRICAERDPKGLYARAKRGDIEGLTGVDDPYEAPVSPDLELDTVGATPEDNARRVLELASERWPGAVEPVPGLFSLTAVDGEGILSVD